MLALDKTFLDFYFWGFRVRYRNRGKQAEKMNENNSDISKHDKQK